MRIVFHQRFYDSDYSDDGSAVSGRMEAIVNVLKTNKQHIFIEPQKADMFDIQRAHKESYILSVKQKPKLYDMAFAICRSCY
jgi:acetoin utilization deacetylase AcuC-like enzyme